MRWVRRLLVGLLLFGSAPALADQGAKDRRAALAAVAHREPTSAELDAAVGKERGPEADAAYRRFAAALASDDPVARRSAYDVLSGVFYCQLKASGRLAAHRALFEADPVLGAKCGDGQSLVMRRSSLRALQDGAAFVAKLTGAPAMSAARWREEAAEAAGYLASASPTQARYFGLAGMNHARAMSIWEALGQTESGRGERARIVAKLKQAKGTSDERLPLFYKLTEEAWSAPAALARFNARMRQAWKDTLWMADESLKTQTLQSEMAVP